MEILLPASWLLVTALHAAPYPRVESEAAMTGPARSRLADDDASLVLFYASEQHGSLETCGCPQNARGSVARIDGYLELVRKNQPETPTLLVNAGNWLDDTIGTDNALRRDVHVKNEWMMRAFDKTGWNALNVSFRDLPWLGDRTFPEPSVSANLRGPGLAPFVVVEAGEHTVAITGVSPGGRDFLRPEGFEALEPEAALAELVPQMEAAADIVVVLAYETHDRTDDLVYKAPGIDVLIEAGAFKNREEAVLERRTVWARTRWQTEFLGELRLWLDDEGNVVRAVDRKIDLDGRIPTTKRARRVEARARDAIDAVQIDLFGEPPEPGLSRWRKQ